MCCCADMTMHPPPTTHLPACLPAPALQWLMEVMQFRYVRLDGSTGGCGVQCGVWGVR